MLDRNDPEAAFKRFREEWKKTNGAPDPDLCQTLVMLQDNPAEYLKLVEEFLDDVS